MVETIAVWFLLAIVQQQGFVGVQFGTQAECEETRITIVGNADVVALSQCTEVKLEKR
jgi:hypothetical protein